MRRYFRASPANVAVRRTIRMEAVNTLHNLHRSGNYDRIIVVAHSLGTVIAYDMLRAYFSRICSDLPPVESFGTDFNEIDTANWQPAGIALRSTRKFCVRKRDGPSRASRWQRKKQAEIKK
jgi:hypothetical protein